MGNKKGASSERQFGFRPSYGTETPLVARVDNLWLERNGIVHPSLLSLTSQLLSVPLTIYPFGPTVGFVTGRHMLCWFGFFLQG